ncbi:MAG: phosphatase PAP2 family protein [Planctomycetes bacterium]|nr:phosphatase PAP2 family protein [Planctomycetota bacterium]
MFAFLTLTVVVAAVRLLCGSTTRPLAELLFIQSALLVGFGSAVIAMVSRERAPWVNVFRPVATVAVMFTCYTTIGRLGVTAMPYDVDAALSKIDAFFFGTDPTFLLEPYSTPGRVEFFSFFYGAFIPYIYVTITLNCIGQPLLKRYQFLTGWVFLYAISYLGYLFLPARGPVILHEHEYAVQLSGGFFYQSVRDGVEATGGLQGAFPSLHVGGSLYLCLFELRENRLRGLVYLPLVLLIYAATLVLRYHYVIDLVAGTVLAALCLPLGRSAVTRWLAKRVAAGLRPLPGGDADDLSAFSPDGAGDAASVLSVD